MEEDPLLLLDAVGDPVQLPVFRGRPFRGKPAASLPPRPPPRPRAPPPALPGAVLALALAAAFACGVATAAVGAASVRCAPCRRGLPPASPPAPAGAGAAATAAAAVVASQQAASPAGAATSAPAPAPVPGRRRRIAVLHKAHGDVTLRGLHAAMLAKQQVEAAGGWYCLLYSAHPADAPPAAKAPGEVPATRAAIVVDALRRALGHGAVAVVGRSDVAGALGARLLAEQRRVFGEQEWAWATNDAVDATWYLLHGEAALPDWAQHVWLLELDVGWTGDLVGALDSTVSCGAPVSGSGAGSGGGSGGGSARGCEREPDWVAFNTMRADQGWRWYAALNFAPPAGIYRSYRHASRLSRALLRLLASELRAGRVASDEAMAPSVCAGAGWCALDAGWQPGHPVIGSDRATGEALYRWEVLIPPQRWQQLAEDDAEAAARCAGAGSGADRRRGAGGERGAQPCVPGRLYHKLKW